MSTTQPPEFPKFLVIVDGRKQYLKLGLAAQALNNGFARVEVGREVLEADFTIRPITVDERRRIDNIADEWAAAK